ncbi:coproporphyrinogen III oxidase [Leifsonia xyli subsp. cynodontis DSM 46306]|jgi:oxygen-independent coproporphyrinogen-3 oxidase|uniref:Heme chaperone HemW n=1 Tax=Leifsonia xyli subsp. cynodontis DSM 46306 TaxID=1389489 RepID=U3P5A6_LEIXC|nr:radical SAM family heme chaperone HemW [Leifsonia xyli]AGW41495.1 coproporphyrinogen III oxidase [Leifsonia xyli subsp. cynodontis DSM 46306]
MPGVLPLGETAPADGALPSGVGAGSADRDFGVYLHVPFCRVRCGYCDFNTYTATELRGVAQTDYADHAATEVRFAARALERSGLPARPVSTVFFGGGTPTLLPPEALGRMLGAVREQWGFAPHAEVTTEANPDSVDAAGLFRLAAAGFTRVSFGMQSAVPRVLATLERTHDPERIPLVVQWARDAGLQVSLDLIYGTPGETLGDWERSLDTALSCVPDHLSAYSLIVEPGTKLARQIASGQIPEPDDDLQADMYERADTRLTGAGYDWYEVSNWAKDDDHRSRHNLAYWLGHDWWGIGPGAHSHIGGDGGGVRWWNVKHPAAYAQRVLAGESPAAGRETLSAETQRVERVLLRTRIREGISIPELEPAGRRAVAGLIADGLVDAKAALAGTAALSLRGRLLADAVVRRLLAEE